MISKYNVFLQFLTALILLAVGCNSMDPLNVNDNQDSIIMTDYEGPYLGQTPPGIIPEMFGPGIISVNENFEHSAAVFSPDGDEVFWCTNVDWYTENRIHENQRLFYMKIIDGKWTAPILAPFCRDFQVQRPVFSPDGNRLYFDCFSEFYVESDCDIFFVERNEEGWSDLTPVSPLINSPSMERLHCITADGSIYFSRDPFTPNEEIFVSRFVNGEFTEPEKLGESYDSNSGELVILVEPNEQYMLIDCMHENSPSALYVCYKKPDGTWSERIKTMYECGGFLALSPDMKYLFFLGEGILWVSTSFIEDLKPHDLR